jgi:hypothetical protein
MTTITLVLFLVYSLIEGVREAYYYHYKWKVVTYNVHDEHAMFTAQRAIAVVSISMMGYPIMGWWCLIVIASMALCFPFVHDGAYYDTRNKLDESVYRKGFFADSKTTTAKVSLKPAARISMFVTGASSAIIFDIVYTLINLLPQ